MLCLISVITANSVPFPVALEDEMNDQPETGRKKKRRKTAPRNVSKSLVVIFHLQFTGG